MSRRTVSAGDLQVTLDGADLRHVQWRGAELVQRIYVAVRDPVWNTIPGRVTVDVEEDADAFTVRLQAAHRLRDVWFDWTGVVTGSALGVLRYEMRGTARSSFSYAKIGFNLHHPLDLVGEPYRAHGPDGVVDSSFPKQIVAQELVNGTLTAMGAPYHRLEIGTGAHRHELEFAGDLFEMQDHRNWTDGNFKTYGTPLSVPLPQHAEHGDVLTQAITLRVTGAGTGTAGRRGAESPGDLKVDLSNLAPPLSLPPVGLVLTDPDTLPTPAETARLAALRPAHLRVDLFEAVPAAARLANATQLAASLDAGLEVAIHVAQPQPDRPIDTDVAGIIGLLKRASARIERIMVFERRDTYDNVMGPTPAWLLHQVRSALADVGLTLPVVGGTNQNFAEINRFPPDAGTMDGMAFGVTPQVHAADDLSLFENLPAQLHVCRSARALVPGTPLHVGPVTLASRTGPYPALGSPDRVLPPRVDVRQRDALAAAWTAGSIRYLTEGAAASLTFFGTVGPEGVTEADTGSPAPAEFPSEASELYPLFHVLALHSHFAGGTLQVAPVTDPSRVCATLLHDASRRLLLIANLTDAEQDIGVHGVPAAGEVRRVSAADTRRNVTLLLEGGDRVASSAEGFHLQVAPYDVVVVEPASM